MLSGPATSFMETTNCEQFPNSTVLPCRFLPSCEAPPPFLSGQPEVSSSVTASVLHQAYHRTPLLGSPSGPVELLNNGLLSLLSNILNSSLPNSCRSVPLPRKHFLWYSSHRGIVFLYPFSSISPEFLPQNVRVCKDWFRTLPYTGRKEICFSH